jgi:hypothetical protein
MSTSSFSLLTVGWVVGALVVVVGSVLVISCITGWLVAGLYMAAGSALIGLWLLDRWLFRGYSADRLLFHLRPDTVLPRCALPSRAHD